MPLWKLQTLRRQKVPFLYEGSSGPRITLLPGVAFNLRRFGALIQLLARSAWVQHIRFNPRNAPTVGGAMKQDPHVDHFIPWSRYPRDLAQNFVLAHNACNLDKGDMLTAPAHLARQAEATEAQLWVSLKYTVNADWRCVEILGG